ncbi:MAG TPA: hypothetical protein VNZ62_05735 [Capillimicrobium sp.]|nr:hypothetical protein [Capillimicrobium sp.]
MCVQCMAGAMTAAAGAAGARSVLAARVRQRFGPRGLRRLTAVLLGAALVASALFVTGSG